MTQALRLDELCKGYKKEVDKWKAKAGALDEALKELLLALCAAGPEVLRGSDQRRMLFLWILQEEIWLNDMI